MAVCEPREQTASQIQEHLDLSAGSVSSAVRMLREGGVLEQASQPGTRRIVYRFAERGWERVFEARVRILSELCRVADRAVDAAGTSADPRLVGMRDTSRSVEEAITTLLRSRCEPR
jgi:DNA-binding transcriptional regulator GbsR (MarR family)